MDACEQNIPVYISDFFGTAMRMNLHLRFLWNSSSLENPIDFSKDLLIESFIFAILLLLYNRLGNYGKCSLVTSIILVLVFGLEMWLMNH